MKKKNKQGAAHPVPTIAFCLCSIVGAVLVVANMAGSQVVPELYPRFIENERGTVVEYLTGIKKLPLFTTEYLTFKNKYGQTLDEGVMKDERANNKEAQQLEELLKTSPGSPEILMRLSGLYQRSGNITLAGDYAARAVDLDPNVITKITPSL